MTCDNCPDAAEWSPEETACNRAHCGEHFATCRACVDEVAAEVDA